MDRIDILDIIKFILFKTDLAIPVHPALSRFPCDMYPNLFEIEREKRLPSGCDLNSQCKGIKP